MLGFTPGDDRTIADWRQITDYFARLDKASDRVVVREIGRSTLQRPIIAAFISARENILTLSSYQEIQRKLADPRIVQTVAERDRLISNGKVVVAISCSIHSTEIVASQMSMQLAYELASAQDPDDSRDSSEHNSHSDSVVKSRRHRHRRRLVSQDSGHCLRREGTARALSPLCRARR